MPDELLFDVAEYLAPHDLLKIAQLNKRCRGVLKSLSDKRRYETVMVDCTPGDADDLQTLPEGLPRGALCHWDTFLNDSNLLATVKLNCRTLIPILPSNDSELNARQDSRWNSDVLITGACGSTGQSGAFR